MASRGGLRHFVVRVVCKMGDLVTRVGRFDGLSDRWGNCRGPR